MDDCTPCGTQLNAEELHLQLHTVGKHSAKRWMTLVEIKLLLVDKKARQHVFQFRAKSYKSFIEGLSYRLTRHHSNLLPRILLCLEDDIVKNCMLETFVDFN